MDHFIYTVLSYPVIIYSVLFIIVLIYWLVCAMGLVDLGSTEADVDLDLDADMDVDVDADMDVDAGGAESGPALGFFTGLLFKFGLYGIPVTIIFSLMIIIGWFLAAVSMQILLADSPSGFTRYGVGSGVFFASLIVSAWITGRFVSPIRRFLNKRKEDTSPQRLCGNPAVVRSNTVTENDGEAVCVSEAFNFILRVQSLPGDKALNRGDTGYLLEYHTQTNRYTIVSEEKFKGL